MTVANKCKNMAFFSTFPTGVKLYIEDADFVALAMFLLVTIINQSQLCRLIDTSDEMFGLFIRLFTAAWNTGRSQTDVLYYAFTVR
jgi:hypothetical protein